MYRLRACPSMYESVALIHFKLIESFEHTIPVCITLNKPKAKNCALSVCPVSSHMYNPAATGHVSPMHYKDHPSFCVMSAH